jgi:hypothetical protein
MPTHRFSVLLGISSAATALLSLLTTTSANAGQFVSVSDDLQLYYEDVGQGPVMVWVPGLAATTMHFSPQIEHFSKNYRVIAYDPRSQGLSLRIRSSTTTTTSMAEIWLAYSTSWGSRTSFSWVGQWGAMRPTRTFALVARTT